MLIGLGLTGCGGTGGLNTIAPDQRLAYKRQQEAAENLEIPPDLMTGRFNDTLDIPPSASGTATYSELQGQSSRRQAISTSTAVVPEVEGVALRRDGGNRWLEAEAPPEQVWPKIVAFWREQGIVLTEQDPTTGMMRTDWLENRAAIRQDFVTNVLRRVADGLYSTSTRDQYRVRLEPGPGRESTEIYLTHRGMAEQAVRGTAGETAGTVWEPSGSDPDKEAEMLRRLMVYLGVSEASAEQMVATDTQAPALARLVTGDGRRPELVIAEEFRRAWRITGLALDRIGFAVEDQDYTQGLFFVRYADTDQQDSSGLLAKLAFWRNDDERKAVAKYQIKLVENGDETQVSVLDIAGRPVGSDTAERLLRLLQEEIR